MVISMNDICRTMKSKWESTYQKSQNELGKLIILEGIDAAGKTTVSVELAKLLCDHNYRAKSISKHFDQYNDYYKNKFSKTLESLIWHDYDDSFITTQGCLYKFALWYVILLNNYINPLLNDYDYLIIDGWFYKIYARLSLKDDIITNIAKPILNSLTVGDIVFLFDLDPNVAYTRRKSFTISELGLMENNGKDKKDYKKSFIEYQNKVRNKLIDMDIVNSEIVDVNNLTVMEIASDLLHKILKSKNHKEINNSTY